jgi:hypothetical protein
VCGSVYLSRVVEQCRWNAREDLGGCGLAGGGSSGTGRCHVCGALNGLDDGDGGSRGRGLGDSLVAGGNRGRERARVGHAEGAVGRRHG